jgi:RNA polymerase sigma factor (sigma-70 family)
MLALVKSETAVPGRERPSPTAEEPLEVLVEGAISGDRAAAQELLNALAPLLLGVVRAILGAGAADVEDVAQESLICFFQALRGFRGECSVRHYGCRIASSTAIAARRRARATQVWLSEFERKSAALSGFSNMRDADALASRRRELLRSLLAELPAAQAETIALRIVLGYSMQEVAAATGAPVNTVRSRLRLAKEALRARIVADPAAPRDRWRASCETGGCSWWHRQRDRAQLFRSNPAIH